MTSNLSVADVFASATAAIETYLKGVSAARATGQATDETSFYPALNQLLTRIGELSVIKRAALSAPKGVSGDFPDVALYEVDSNVLVLPVEVKGATADITKLARSAQAKRYALSFGGGRVLVTNLWQFALAEIDAAGKLVLRQIVNVADPAQLDAAAPTAIDNVGSELLTLIEGACSVRGALTDPGDVARLLAYHGRRMNLAISAAGDPATLLSAVGRSFQDGLGMELDDDLLRSTTVQTLIYGLFAAWLDADDPHDFEWLSAAYELSLPLYADIVHSILTPAFVRDCDLPSYLAAVARTLSWVDRDAFEAAFDGGAIDYFYEPFLAAFDQELRSKLGVWYTPREIADYQAARVEHHLIADLGLPNGFAESEQPLFVLDPACGTGTYLLAVMRRIRQHHIENGHDELFASQRAAEAIRDRIIGFEILPAAFVVAHINVHRTLSRWGVALAASERPRIYLTNALLGWGVGDSAPSIPLSSLAAEIQEANQVKAVDPVLAILGNPPWEGFSAAENAEERALLLPWSADLWTKYRVRKSRLGDLYVRFWRVAVNKITNLTGRGVVSFVTNRNWLAGRSFPLMREAICRDFSQITIDDLHGGLNEMIDGDETAFKTASSVGIRVGAAIVTAVRVGDESAPTSREYWVRDLKGSAGTKQQRLSQWATSSDPAVAMTEGLGSRQTDRVHRWRFAEGGLEGAPELDEYIPTFFSGVQPVRDSTVTDRSRTALRTRMEDYFDYSKSFDEVAAKHPGVDAGQNPRGARQRLQDLTKAFDETRLTRFCYKPFDWRWLYWELDGKLLNRAREDLAAQWPIEADQMAIASAQTARRPGAARPHLTTAVPGYHVVDPDARVFLRYLATATATTDVGGGGQLTMSGLADVHHESSVAREWIDAARRAGVDGTDLEVGDVVYFALSAVLQGKVWLESQPASLDAFPTVPLPSDPQALIKAAEVGRRYFELSDLDSDVDGVTSGMLDPRWSRVGRVSDFDPAHLTEGRANFNGGTYDSAAQAIRWDADGSRGWLEVPIDVWEYSVGGFPVLQKLLSYHVGEVLTVADREHVAAVCRRIAATLALTEQADDLYWSALGSPLEVAAPHAPVSNASGFDGLPTP